MTHIEQNRIAVAIAGTAIISSTLTALVVRKGFEKRVAKIVEVLDSYRHITQWTSHHIMDLDREEFAREFMMKAMFHNIVVQES